VRSPNGPSTPPWLLLHARGQGPIICQCVKRGKSDPNGVVSNHAQPSNPATPSLLPRAAQWRPLDVGKLSCTLWGGGAFLPSFTRALMCSFSASPMSHAPVLPPPCLRQPSLDLGSCWAFPGSAGNLTVLLREPILIDKVSIDHPTLSNDTAPKHCTVWVRGRAPFVPVCSRRDQSSPRTHPHARTFARIPSQPLLTMPPGLQVGDGPPPREAGGL
jgi:hypothetical protein